MYRDLRDGATPLQGLAAQFNGTASPSTGDRSQIVAASLVSGTWFETLGVKNALERPITPDDYKTVDAHPVAVLSHALCQRRFGSDRAIVNKKYFNGHPHDRPRRNPGRLPRHRYSESPRSLHPLAMQRLLMPNSARLQDRRLYFLNLFAASNPV